jgi:bifunctional enzyme CysN/CysC
VGDFVEIHVDTPLEVCQQRDPKGLYRQAEQGSIPNMTGVGQDYEAPLHAEVVVSGTGSVDEIARSIVSGVMS